jgi:Kef-type K+ transport system membrane component KefB
MRTKNDAPDADVVRSMDQAGSLLLPLFFIVTGLSLNIGSVYGDALILLILIVLIASVGKLGPAYAASRLSGLQPRQSATVAALVNTRGLTELIALNVGLQAGLINQRLFTVLVLMAILTTLMTSPLLSVIRPVRASVPGEAVRLTNT